MKHMYGVNIPMRVRISYLTGNDCFEMMHGSNQQKRGNNTAMMAKRERERLGQSTLERPVRERRTIKTSVRVKKEGRKADEDKTGTRTQERNDV